MDVRQLLRDDDAVSPVIGVILMVAITVILAAVIASFVLGFSDDRMNTQPQATFAFDYNETASDNLTVVHDNGDTIHPDRLNASVDGAMDDSNSAVTFGNDGDNNGGDLYNSSQIGEVRAGTTYEINKTDFHSMGGNNLELSEATVRVVYTAESGDNSATLGKWEGPDA